MSTTTAGTTVTDAQTGWVVDFWLDPACPLTRHTARWITQIADEVPLEVNWRVMSLSILNEHRDDDPEGDPHGYLWIPARVAAAVQTRHGHESLGAFYDALWTNPDGTERQWLGELGEALQRTGLSVELVKAGTSTDYDAELRASHRDGVDRIDAEIGTPIMAITAPDGGQRTFFGPVLDTVPTMTERFRLWEALLLLTKVPSLREIKA
ncbi:mycothiol-dependent nitroreductase Rv2466c family protein [Nocardiopsis sp. NPDC055551]|uniref:mycothiol-dependent nitroreductase Rv2466c family protein n=1 Tax=Nocardiopsis sp. NPDC006832 TaxID=3157188 RepID=UPI003404AEEA